MMNNVQTFTFFRPKPWEFWLCDPCFLRKRSGSLSSPGTLQVLSSDPSGQSRTPSQRRAWDTQWLPSPHRCECISQAGWTHTDALFSSQSLRCHMKCGGGGVDAPFFLVSRGPCFPIEQHSFEAGPRMFWNSVMIWGIYDLFYTSRPQTPQLNLPRLSTYYFYTNHLFNAPVNFGLFSQYRRT